MLIEREEPLNRLRGVLQRATQGHGGVVVLGGEAGIGKTSLLRAFAQRTGETRRIFWGGCEALFTPRPLGPLHDMAHAIDPRLTALFDQAASQDRLFPALLNALQGASGATILIFEDVHWADNATLDLIKYVGRRVALLRAVLLLSLRTDEVGVDHPLTQVLGDLPSQSTTRIELAPLSANGVALLAQQAGSTGEGLHAITGGNPFFITELLARNDTATTRIPASIRDAVWSRISRLSPEEREVLEVMSIVPGAIEPWLLQALLGSSAERIVEQCVAHGVLLRDGQGLLRFRHELARLATLERLPVGAQKALHAKVGEALSEGATIRPMVSLSSRVHHAAGANDGATVLTLAPLAAAQAARLGAHRQAASHLATALRYVDSAPMELAAQLYEDWAYEAGLALGIDDAIIDARKRAIALWRELKRADRVGFNLRWLSRSHWYRGESRLAGDYIAQALRELEAFPPGPELAMAYSVRSQMHFLHDEPEEAIAWGERAIALAEHLGETETRIHALNNVGSAMLFSDRPGGRIRLEKSLSLALEHGFHEQAARAYTNFAEYAVVFKEFPLAERLVAEGVAFDTQHDLDSWTYYLVGRQAQLRLEQGRLREAETIAQGVMNLDRLTLLMKLPALTVLAKARVRLGEPDGADLLDRARRDAAATGERQYIMPVLFGLVEAAWLSQDDKAAKPHLMALAAMNTASFDPWERGELAVWSRRCKLPLPFSASNGVAAAPQAAELQGDYSGAAAQWSLLGLPYEAALALLQTGGHDAGPSLAQAISMFEAIEARPAAQLARARAKALGVAAQMPRPRRGHYAPASSHPLGLTKREVQVLGFIVRGLGNQEIARHIVRSQRTVEHHVSAILAKLNAGNRIDVLLRVQSEPWLLPSADVGQSGKN